MYERETNSGHTVKWNPEHSDLAAQAMADVAGSGVSTATEARQKAKVDFGEDAGGLAQQVTERYQELVNQQKSTSSTA
jgi:hypothetical protein